MLNEKLKTTRQIVFAAVCLALLYVYFKYGFAIYPIINGVLVAVLTGLLIATLELNFFSRNNKELKFIWLLTIRTIIYFFCLTFILFIVEIFSRVLQYNLNLMEVINSPKFQRYIVDGNFLIEALFLVALAFVINFTRMLNRKMGQGFLAAFIQGTYYVSKHEVRIVLFIRIQDSRQILNRLGPLKYYKFMNDLIYDITEPVQEKKAIIYEYLEDLIVVTWPINKGLDKGNCVNLYFDILDVLHTNQNRYYDVYGLTPKLSAALHLGSLIVSEVGEIKSQIVLRGNTMNTTSRILSKSSEMKIGLLASDQMLKIVGLPQQIQKKSIGEINLKGKQESMLLFELLKID